MHVIIFSVGSQTLTLFSKTVSKFLPLDGKLHRWAYLEHCQLTPLAFFHNPVIIFKHFFIFWQSKMFQSHHQTSLSQT